jgi:hypothetical protein
MNLFDEVLGTALKTAFSPFTAVASVIDDVLDVSHEDRWDTFVNNEPGIDLRATLFELGRGK